MIIRAKHHRGFRPSIFSCLIHPSHTARFLTPKVQHRARHVAMSAKFLDEVAKWHEFALERFQKDPIAKNVLVASNSNQEDVRRDLWPLLLSNGGAWQLGSDGKSIERVFKFKTFVKTWQFMSKVAEECKIRKHHPEWVNVYNRVFIRWTTHRPLGLSELDLSMATFCEREARNLDEVASLGETIAFRAPTVWRQESTKDTGEAIDSTPPTVQREESTKDTGEMMDSTPPNLPREDSKVRDN